MIKNEKNKQEWAMSMYDGIKKELVSNKDNNTSIKLDQNNE